MHISSLSNTDLKIGTVFTPCEWGMFAIAKFRVFEKWLQGATVFDPTMGEGDLLLSLIEYGVTHGYPIRKLPIKKLYGVELNTSHYEKFFINAMERYNIKMPRENFFNEDIFFVNNNIKFDILLGNPPWLNFVDLPDSYKHQIKKLFYQYDLIQNAQSLLLGGSRIDIAALVLQKTIVKDLITLGEAIFFIPLSLLLNDGANRRLRKYKVNGVDYSIESIYDFNSLKIFNDVSTRYGMIHIKRDKKQTFPIEYHQWNKGEWKYLYAQPIFNTDDPLSISERSTPILSNFKQIKVNKYSQPRQGVNTGGANDIYIFDSCTSIDEDNYRVINKTGESILPKKYIYPLIIGKNFNEEIPTPYKWVLIPHSKNGKPLSMKEAQLNVVLWKYLEKYKDILINRKGVLISTWIKKNIWWALLGVGDYNFTTHKIVWEAYGKKVFTPKIFTYEWQANQSLQAYMPVKSSSEGQNIMAELIAGDVEKYLLSLNMEGTMNWAQPGKIKKLLSFREDNMQLFPV